MRRYLCLFLFSAVFTSCGVQEVKSSFEFKRDDQGIELKENGQPIFFYQKTPKSRDGEYICNNYLHPLYTLNGDTLTEEFPKDHPYHRGIFWAWHQIYINGESVGDGWIMENIVQEVINVQTTKKESPAQMELKVLWRSPLYKDNKPFVSEHTTITVYPLQNAVRKIDFAIVLKALVPGVEIGGSNDEKGYGGLCVRLKLPEDLTFTSSGGPITPQVEQIKAGPWMDFSASFTAKGKKTGVAILCHSQTLNYPAPWIIRSKTSMQNIVFPGRDRVELPVHDKSIALYYRLIVHNGEVNSINLSKLQSEYEKTVVSK